MSSTPADPFRRRVADSNTSLPIAEAHRNRLSATAGLTSASSSNPRVSDSAHAERRLAGRKPGPSTAVTRSSKLALSLAIQATGGGGASTRTFVPVSAAKAAASSQITSTPMNGSIPSPPCAVARAARRDLGAPAMQARATASRSRPGSTSSNSTAPNPRTSRKYRSYPGDEGVVAATRSPSEARRRARCW